MQDTPKIPHSRWATRSVLFVLAWVPLAGLRVVAGWVATLYNAPLVMRILEVGLLCLPILIAYAAFKSLQRTEPRVWLALIAFIIAIFQFVAALIALNTPYQRILP